MFGLPSLPRNLNAALRDVEHPKREVRLSALRDLVRHSRGTERGAAIAKLAEVLAGNADVELRAEAAMALADADAREALPELLVAAHASEVRVRQMAVLALGEVASEHDPEALSVLQEAWAGSDAPVRFQALVALHHVAGDAVEAVLFDAARDSDPEIRSMAFRIVEERFQERDAPPHLVAATHTALSDAERSVGLCAAIVLASWGDARGGDVLLQVASGALKVGTEADQQAAIEFCAKLELPGAASALERRAFGSLGLRFDPMSWHARVALARLGDERAKIVILRGLRAWTRDARTVAVVAAGRARLRDAEPQIAAMRGDPSRADPDAVAQALVELAEVR